MEASKGEMGPTAPDLLQLARLVAATAPDELDCGAVLDRVAAYLEAHRGERAPTDELAAVEQHLEVCPDCREEFQALVEAYEQLES